MAIAGSDGLIKVRVRGIDQAIRDLARTDQEHKRAAKSGILKAAQYLMEKIRDKFGSYQPTGGTGGGRWAKLTFDTNKSKLRKYGFMNKPLIATGAMKDSFSVREGGDKTLAASVVSNDPKMIYHVYGAPGANVPPRDPMLVTAVEEADNCRKIIIEELYQVYK